MSTQPQFKHQDFSIDNSQRKRIVRQDRFFSGNITHKLKFKNNTYEIDNYSTFGVAIKSQAPELKTTESLKAVYSVHNHEICELDLKYARATDDGLIAFTIEGQPLSIEAIQAVEKSYLIISTFESENSKYSNIPTLLKSKTFELKSWLENLEKQVSGIEKNSFEMPTRELQHYEEAIAQTISQYLDNKLPLFANEIGAAISNLSNNEIKLCYEFLRAQVGPLFYKSTYGNRAYTKPRGYAGDYEMMNNVYFNELRGESLFAKCMQRFFTDSSAGKAVRNRAEYLNQKIEIACKKSHTPKILGVASGPAREIQKFFLEKPEMASKCEIHLLDQDTDALKFSQRDIFEICRQKNVKPNIHFHNLAIKNVISDGLPMSGFDLIYSAGLFDYFTDPVAQFAANRLFTSLNPGGQLIIGNFNTRNPSQFVMEALGDWYLIYRSEETLKELFSMITPNLHIECEKEGVNLFAVMEK